MYRGIIAGGVAGLVGTWAMNEVQRLWTRAVDDDAPESAGGRHDARDWQERSEHRNSNELAAQAVAGYILGRDLTRDELRLAAPLVHFLFGAAVGAIYGAYAERRQADTTGAGFGTTVWLAADEIAMPLLGLSDSTARRPLEMHLQSLVAHLVYGYRDGIDATLGARAIRHRDTTRRLRSTMRIGSSRNTGLMLVAAGLATAVAVTATRRRPTFGFSGKSVVITGGSRGLGLVLARQLAAEGARLTLIARDETELLRAAHDIRERQPSAEVLIVRADVGEREDVGRAIAQTIEDHGTVDVLINDAGIIGVGPLDHMKLSDYDDAMKTHFWGPLYLVLAVLPHMRNQGGGRIVNISSIGGRMSVPHMLPYSASKFALTGLSDGLRAELARDQIVVTTVCPGLMRIGSPVNAVFKGQRAHEFSWFAIASSLPLLTISAERAARQILDACSRGDAELVITIPAKLAVLARTLAPELFSDAMSLVNRVLPRAVGSEGDVAESGRLAGSNRLSSTVLAPMYAAAQKNNEL